DAFSIAEANERGDELVPLLARGTVPPGAEHATIEVPLMSQGSYKGLLCVHRVAAPFAHDEVQLASWFGDAAALALDNVRIRTALKQQADSDSLTGLVNYRSFQERLRAQVARLREADGTLTLLMLDIDDFKRINDVYGHATRDDVLVAIAELLRRGARATDEICRLGRVEFGVI